MAFRDHVLLRRHPLCLCLCRLYLVVHDRLVLCRLVLRIALHLHLDYHLSLLKKICKKEINHENMNKTDIDEEMGQEEYMTFSPEEESSES